MTGVSGRTRSTTSCTTPSNPKLERSTRIRSRSRSVTIICLPCGVISFISVTQDDNCAMPGAVRGLRQGGHRHRTQGNLADFRGQRQFLAALGERLDQGAHAHAGLGAHAVFAEFQDPSRSLVSTVVPPSPPTQRVCE